jgi:hypothetical protein
LHGNITDFYLMFHRMLARIGLYEKFNLIFSIFFRFVNPGGGWNFRRPITDRNLT